MRFKIITICLLLFSLAAYCQIYEIPNLKFDSAVGEKDSNGKKTGEWVFYRKDKSLSAKIHFLNAEREGITKMYWENGNLYNSVNYAIGKKEGIDKTYYKDGSIAYSISYKNGLKNGEEKKYKNNGTIYSIKNYKNDALHGVSIDFDSDGEISKNGTYENGKKQGKWLNYRKGKVSLEAEYNLDVPDGIWKKRFSYPEELNDKVEYEYKISNGAIINPIKIYDYTDMYSKDGKVDKQFWIGNVNTENKSLDSPYRFKKIGEWKKYNSKGNLISEEMFDSDGITISKLDYFDNGKTKYKTIRDKNNIIKKIGYYENGKVSFKAESKFISERKEEVISSVEYDEEGVLEYKQDGSNHIYYYKGKISETWTADSRGHRYGEYLKYNDNGSIYIRGNYSYLKDRNGYNRGYKMGIWIEYHDNGEIKIKGNYARNEDDVFEGLKDGAWKYYNEEGKLIKTENYSNGIKQ